MLKFFPNNLERGYTMLDLTYSEWYLLIAFAIVAGSIQYHIGALKEQRRLRIEKNALTEEFDRLRAKQKLAKQYALRTEVVRTRYMVDAWLLRHPSATLRHPGAKIVLNDHLNALRAFFDHEGCVQYTYPDTVAKQYDNAYWRALWHVYHHGNVRNLPPCPLEI